MSSKLFQNSFPDFNLAHKAENFHTRITKTERGIRDIRDGLEEGTLGGGSGAAEGVVAEVCCGCLFQHRHPEPNTNPDKVNSQLQSCGFNHFQVDEDALFAKFGDVLAFAIERSEKEIYARLPLLPRQNSNSAHRR